MFCIDDFIMYPSFFSMVRGETIGFFVLSVAKVALQILLNALQKTEKLDNFP